MTKPISENMLRLLRRAATESQTRHGKGGVRKGPTRRRTKISLPKMTCLTEKT